MGLVFKEFLHFSKTNWWVFIFFLICLFIIVYTNSGNLFEIIFIFVLHFFADVFIILMGFYYLKGLNSKANFYQLLAFLIFTFIGLYELFFHNIYTYIVPQFIFLLPLLKAYFPKLKFLNLKSALFISFIILFFYFNLGFLYNLGFVFQFLGFIVFPLSLMLENNKIKYYGSMAGIFLIVLGSGFNLYYSILAKSVTGADISFFILPIVVLLGYLKNKNG